MAKDDLFQLEVDARLQAIDVFIVQLLDKFYDIDDLKTLLELSEKEADERAGDGDAIPEKGLSGRGFRHRSRVLELALRYKLDL